MRSYNYITGMLEKTVYIGYSSDPNRFALNPVDVNIREPYLRIFGKFNTHLPSGITIGAMYRKYSYVLNSDNVMIKRIETGDYPSDKTFVWKTSY